MKNAIFEGLSREAQTLVQDAMAHLSTRYDPETHLVLKHPGDFSSQENRGSLYYALGLLLTGGQQAAQEAEKICDAVLNQLIDAPTEIFHGAFLHPGQKMPPQGVLEYDRLGTYGRYSLDCFYERLSDAFRRNLEDDPRFSDRAETIDQLLREAALSVHPMVYATYEPCSREFLLMCFAMMLEHFEDRLSSRLVKRIDDSAKIVLEGAVTRSRTDFSPLNTNIQCMHVFIIDYFGHRFAQERYCRYALSYAQSMLRTYQEYHAAAEFNSPTYCGVDLATLGFWRRYGSCGELRTIGTVLEEGIWRDMMDFFNPAMMNFCGPYTRAYELEMGLHTHFHALFFLSLGEKAFPQHPYTNESDSNPLLVLGDVRMPEDLKKAVLASRKDAFVRRQFRELSERGDPDHNNALCTATAWISPDLMIGALAGSENPSYQLHPLVAFWRHNSGLGTMKLLRKLPNGRMIHMHTVLFDGRAERNRAVMDVHVDVNRDVIVFFEIECDGIETAQILPNKWELPGLRVLLDAQTPVPYVEKVDGRTLRVCYPARVRQPGTMRMHFDLRFERTSSDQ